MLKILPLTSLRFFAAAGVVAYHIHGNLGTVAPPPLVLGVSFFFVLSGFILTYTYRDQERFSYAKFTVARFARLWPVHIATLLIVVYLFDPPNVWPVTLSNAALLHSWVPFTNYIFSLNAVSWTISNEIFFYLMFPLLAFGNRIKYIGTGLVVVVLITLHWIDGNYTNAQIYQMPVNEFSAFHLIQQSPIIRILEFAAGVLAGRLFLSGSFRSLIQKRATIFELAGVATVAFYCLTAEYIHIALIVRNMPAIGLWYSQSGGLLVFAATILIFAYSNGVLSRALSWRPLVFLGEISFCTYMVHQICMRFAGDSYFVYPDASGPWRVASLVAAIYLASFVLWFFVERPFRAAIVGTYGWVVKSKQGRQPPHCLASQDIRS